MLHVTLMPAVFFLDFCFLCARGVERGADEAKEEITEMRMNYNRL